MKIKATSKKPVNETSDEKIEDKTGKISRKEQEIPIPSVPKKTVITKHAKGNIIERLRDKRERRGSIEPRYESWNDEINEVALKMADMFPHFKLDLSVSDPSKAPEVYGYLKDNYRNYNFLIENYVLEVACWYSKNKKDSKLEIIKVVDGIDLENYKWSMVELDGIHRFENYKNIPVTNIMFLCEDFLDDAIYWLEDSEWILDNEEVRINLGRFCGVQIARISWNVPVFLVTYIPFRNKGIYKAKMEAKQITKVQEDARLKLINTYRAVMDTYEEQIDELNRESKNWKKMYSDQTKKMALEYRRMVAKIEARSNGAPVRANRTNLILIVFVVVMAILAIVGFLT